MPRIFLGLTKIIEINMDWTKLSEIAAAAIGALVAAGIAIKFVSSRKSSKSIVKRTVVQKNNTAGRDIVGGDVKIKR